MLKLGITGGIATGKTEAMRIFADLQIPSIDADQVAHEILSHDSEVKNKVLERYGPGVLNSHGYLNRRSLRDIIFNNANEKKFIESLLHPLIFSKINNFIEAFSKVEDVPYIILVIPLLFETKCQQLVDKILVLDTPFETQIKRLIKRDSINLDQIISIINHQLDREQRLQGADYVIYNNSHVIDLHNDVFNLDQILRNLN